MTMERGDGLRRPTEKNNAKTERNTKIYNNEKKRLQ